MNVLILWTFTRTWVPGTAAAPKGGLIMGCANMTGCCGIMGMPVPAGGWKGTVVHSMSGIHYSKALAFMSLICSWKILRTPGPGESIICASMLEDGRESLRHRSGAGHIASSSQPGFVAVCLPSVSIILKEIKPCFLMDDGPKIC